MHEYKVIYKDGRRQTITADSYGRYGSAYVFSRNRQDIFSVDAESVESVGLADIPEPTRRAPRSVGV
jgi:hypothetical protein